MTTAPPPVSAATPDNEPDTPTQAQAQAQPLPPRSDEPAPLQSVAAAIISDPTKDSSSAQGSPAGTAGDSFLPPAASPRPDQTTPQSDQSALNVGAPDLNGNGSFTPHNSTPQSSGPHYTTPPNNAPYDGAAYDGAAYDSATYETASSGAAGRGNDLPYNPTQAPLAPSNSASNHGSGYHTPQNSWQQPAAAPTASYSTEPYPPASYPPGSYPTQMPQPPVATVESSQPRGPLTGTIIWGCLIIAFCGFVTQRILAPAAIDPAVWITAVVLFLGVTLVGAGIASLFRQLRDKP